jgi:hypothetical protein
VSLFVQSSPTSSQPAIRKTVSSEAVSLSLEDYAGAVVLQLEDFPQGAWQFRLEQAFASLAG